MSMSPKLNVNEWMSELDLLLDKNSKRIKCTDADGNEFKLLSNGAQTVINRSTIKTAVVRLPSYISGEDGTKYQLTGLASHAFFEQQTLKHLIIPDGVWSIETGAFSCCGSLLSVVIPASVQKLDAAFWNCPAFEENDGGRIYYTGSQEQWRVLIDSDPHRRIMDYTSYDEVVQFVSDGKNFDIPDIDIHTIYDEDIGQEISRVRVCELGGEVAIPETYTDTDGVVQKINHIGRSSFAGNNRIERVIIPSTIQRICQDAFYHCANLREVVILKSDEALDIEMGAFFNCERLERIYVGRPCSWGAHALENTNAQRMEIDF